MKQETVTDCKTRKEVFEKLPWANRVAKVEGGFIAFESIDAYERWNEQI
jgi:hypothetical protein